MAKRRMRVCIGYKDDGSPVVTQVSADTELELSDKIVQTVLKSARRSEFVQIAERAAAEELPTIPNFETYTEEWFQVYKAERIKRTTAGGYRSVIEGHFYPVFPCLPSDRKKHFVASGDTVSRLVFISVKPLCRYPGRGIE